MSKHNLKGIVDIIGLAMLTLAIFALFRNLVGYSIIILMVTVPIIVMHAPLRKVYGSDEVAIFSTVLGVLSAIALYEIIYYTPFRSIADRIIELLAIGAAVRSWELVQEDLEK